MTDTSGDGGEGPVDPGPAGVAGKEDDSKGVGHNIPREHSKWERWTRIRTFVRALEGTYGNLLQELFDQPRVYSSKDWTWGGGLQNHGMKIIN